LFYIAREGKKKEKNLERSIWRKRKRKTASLFSQSQRKRGGGGPESYSAKRKGKKRRERKEVFGPASVFAFEGERKGKKKGGGTK